MLFLLHIRKKQRQRIDKILILLIRFIINLLKLFSSLHKQSLRISTSRPTVSDFWFGKQHKVYIGWPLKSTPLGDLQEGLSSKFLTRGEVSGRATRNSQLLHIPLSKSKSGQRTFFYRTVSLWNSLDNSLKLCNSSRNFKHKLRAKLFAAFLSLRS